MEVIDDDILVTFIQSHSRKSLNKIKRKVQQKTPIYLKVGKLSFMKQILKKWKEQEPNNELTRISIDEAATLNCEKVKK